MGLVRDSLSAVAAQSPSPPTFARVGLGLTILLAGVHKLFDPAAFHPDVICLNRGATNQEYHEPNVLLWCRGTLQSHVRVYWTVYVTDWLAPWLVVSPVAFMLLNGVLEVGFGGAILADRWTAVAAGVAAVSLSATVGYLAVVAVLEGGRFVDVLVRDVGLAALALAVTVRALQSDDS